MTPREKGRYDFAHGTTTNWYPLGTPEHDEWRRGYDEQKRKEELDRYWEERDEPSGPKV